MRRSRTLLAAVVLVASPAVASACGDDDGNGGAAPDGRALFVGGTQPSCADCHTLTAAGSQSQVGPDLDPSLAPAAFIAQVIRDGPGVMPSFEGDLSDAEIDAIAEFVEQSSGS